MYYEKSLKFTLVLFKMEINAWYMVWSDATETENYILKKNNQIYLFSQNPFFLLNYINIFNCKFVFVAEEMDRKDGEMREVIKKVWPAQARKMLDHLLPPNSGKFSNLWKKVCLINVFTILSFQTFIWNGFYYRYPADFIYGLFI